jgi:hypothetical protein
LAVAVAFTVMEPDVTFRVPDGVVVPPTDPFTLTVRCQTEDTEVLANMAVRVWFEPKVCAGITIEFVVLLDVTLKAEVMFALSNCQ